MTRLKFSIVLIGIIGAYFLLGPKLEQLGSQEQIRNAGVEPAVVHPGDSFRIYFPTDIRSVNGLWRGSDPAFKADSDSASALEAEVTTNVADWGSELAEKGEPKFRPFITLRLKRTPWLAGRTIRGTASVDVEYPSPTKTASYAHPGAATFEMAKEHVTTGVSFKVSASPSTVVATAAGISRQLVPAAVLAGVALFFTWATALVEWSQRR